MCNHFQCGSPVRCVIAFGGNIGNPDETFRLAWNDLQSAGLVIDKISTVITTKPLGCPDGTPDFRNGVLIAQWSHSPKQLLHLCQSLEVKYGRPQNHPRNVSRTLDLDIILFGTLHSDDPELILPHPRAKERDFVCIPLAETAPDLLALL